MALDDDNIPADVFHKLLEAARANLAPPAQVAQYQKADSQTRHRPYV